MVALIQLLEVKQFSLTTADVFNNNQFEPKGSPVLLSSFVCREITMECRSLNYCTREAVMAGISNYHHFSHFWFYFSAVLPFSNQNHTTLEILSSCKGV